MYDRIPDEYRPIGAWGYFGYSILFAIPVIGFIVLIIFALGGTRNINLRSYARSYFCWIAICLIFVAVLVVTGGGIAVISELFDAIKSALPQLG